MAPMNLSKKQKQTHKQNRLVVAKGRGSGEMYRIRVREIKYQLPLVIRVCILTPKLYSRKTSNLPTTPEPSTGDD